MYTADRLSKREIHHRHRQQAPVKPELVKHGVEPAGGEKLEILLRIRIVHAAAQLPARLVANVERKSSGKENTGGSARTSRSKLRAARRVFGRDWVLQPATGMRTGTAQLVCAAKYGQWNEIRRCAVKAEGA